MISHPESAKILSDKFKSLNYLLVRITKKKKLLKTGFVYKYYGFSLFFFFRYFNFLHLVKITYRLDNIFIFIAPRGDDEIHKNKPTRRHMHAHIIV